MSDAVKALERAQDFLEDAGYTVRDRIEEAALTQRLFDMINLLGMLSRAATDFLSDPNDFEYKKALRQALEASATRDVASRAE